MEPIRNFEQAAAAPLSRSRLPSDAKPSRGSRALLAAAALAALMTAGAAGALLVPSPGSAVAQGVDGRSPVTLAQPAQINGPATFADLVDRVRPAVVSVRVKVGAPAAGVAMRGPAMDGNSALEEFLRQFRDRRGQQMPPRAFGESQGSGFIISADGYVVTNNHVVANGTEVSVTTDDGRTLKARVVGTDPKTDLAVLKIEEGGTFAFVDFAGETPRVGDWVVAVGNPFGLGGTVTKGIVSARGRDIGAGPYDDFLQIDAAVNRGNSGGPTFNLKGEVVGVNTAIASPSGGSVGIAFAVPSETARTVVRDLVAKGQVTRGLIGVQIQAVTPEIAEALGLKQPEGALVADAMAGGPAAKAGVRRGDVIVGLGDETIRSGRELSRKVASLQPGAKAQVRVWRDGRERTLDITVGRQGDI